MLTGCLCVCVCAQCAMLQDFYTKPKPNQDFKKPRDLTDEIRANVEYVFYFRIYLILKLEMTAFFLATHSLGGTGCIPWISVKFFTVWTGRNRIEFYMLEFIIEFFLLMYLFRSHYSRNSYKCPFWNQYFHCCVHWT